MNEHSPPALEEYYREAATWNRDRVESARSSRRVAWCIACGAAFIAILEAIALVVLMPLKTVQPYTLLVDRTTGYVQGINPVEPARITPDAAITQSFLVQYVIARESFDLSTLKANYRKVALFSGEAARSGYTAGMQVSNPASPLNVYPRITIVEARVKSVSPTAPDAAFVRFDTIRTDGNGQVQPPVPWVAVVHYQYSGEPMRLEDRFVNPLGFRVLRYRRDPEALPPATPVAVPASAQTVAVNNGSAPPLPIADGSQGVATASPYYARPRR